MLKKFKSVFKEKELGETVESINDFYDFHKRKLAFIIIPISQLIALYQAFGRPEAPKFFMITNLLIFFIDTIGLIMIIKTTFNKGMFLILPGNLIVFFIHFFVILLYKNNDYRFPLASSVIYSNLIIFLTIITFLFLNKKQGIIAGVSGIVYVLISIYMIPEKRYIDNILSPLNSIICTIIVLTSFNHIFNKIYKSLLKSKSDLKKQVKERTMELEKANQSKNLFLANVSHDLRTPLNSIIGFSRFLKKNISEQEKDKYIDIISESGKNLLCIINDILDISKIEAGEIEFNYEYFNLCDNIEYLKTIYCDKIKNTNRNINFNVKLSDDLPNYILMDKSRFNQIIFNLIDNSIKFTDKGDVELKLAAIYKTDKDKLDLEIIVSDSGIGIKKEEKNKIFNEFSHSKKNNKSGVGLGLSIVKKLIDKMNGFISFESIENKGSSFRVIFKDVIFNNKELIKIDDSIIKYNFDEKKILIIEDDKDCIEMLKKLLETNNLKIYSADTGIQGIKKAVEILPDCILLDIRLPDISGYEVLEKIKNMVSKEIPVIAMSASAMISETEKIFKSGFGAFIKKPIENKLLLDNLRLFLSENKKNDNFQIKINELCDSLFQIFDEEINGLIKNIVKYNNLDDMESFVECLENKQKTLNNPYMEQLIKIINSALDPFDIENLILIFKILNDRIIKNESK